MILNFAQNLLAIYFCLDLLVVKFLGDNNREFLQQRQRTVKKIIHLECQKNNFARASPFFVHFLAVVAQLRHETS